MTKDKSLEYGCNNDRIAPAACPARYRRASSMYSHEQN